MIANHDPVESNPNEVQSTPEPVWQTLAGCATLVLGLVMLWWLG